MRFFKILSVLLIAFALVISCKQSKKEMTPEDFMKIDDEVIATDQKPDSVEKITKQYGYTLKQYNDFKEKMEKDPKLKEKLGDLRLKGNKLEIPEGTPVETPKEAPKEEKK
ncbi:MAG: hypothetical protein GY754_31255 [bacterium]|nr:hypothetical protein [bacterium]